MADCKVCTSYPPKKPSPIEKFVNTADSELKNNGEMRLSAFIHPFFVQEDVRIYDYFFKTP